MKAIALLLLGGGAGTLCRYAMAMWILDRFGSGFPWGTFSVNLLGCFLIGLLAGLPQGTLSLSPALRLLCVTGFLGGFTTFSSYQYDSFLLLNQAAYDKLIFNMAGSVLAGGAALGLGYALVRGGTRLLIR